SRSSVPSLVPSPSVSGSSGSVVVAASVSSGTLAQPLLATGAVTPRSRPSASRSPSVSRTRGFVPRSRSAASARPSQSVSGRPGSVSLPSTTPLTFRSSPATHVPATLAGPSQRP